MCICLTYIFSYASDLQYKNATVELTKSWEPSNWKTSQSYNGWHRDLVGHMHQTWYHQFGYNCSISYWQHVTGLQLCLIQLVITKLQYFMR